MSKTSGGDNDPDLKPGALIPFAIGGLKIAEIVKDQYDKAMEEIANK